VTHPLLQRSQRHVARGGDARAERVPEVVETHNSDAGAATRALEALADPRSIERLAGLRVREDQVVIAGVRRVAGELLERTRELLGDRHPAGPAA
jgi:hypothetical protein